MNLLKTLILDDAELSGVNLVPTKRFFKPVIVMRAPLTVDAAELIGCSYLFVAGAVDRPVPFDGTHKLHGEVVNAEVVLGSDGKPFAAERVAHFNIARSEEKNDKPVGLVVRLRIHIAEFEHQADLLKLLAFLADLNKSKTTLWIRSSQGSLIEKISEKVANRDKGLFEKAGTDASTTPILTDKLTDDGQKTDEYPAADPDSGLYPMDHAFKKPFAHQSPALTAKLFGLEVLNGYIAGWEIKTGKGFSVKFEAGETLSTRRPICSSEREALEGAAAELVEYARSRVLSKPADHRAVAALIDWIGTEGLLPKPAERAAQ